MNKIVPFYRDVSVTKVIGGKKPLWHARLAGSQRLSDLIQVLGARARFATGASNTADGAIADLQKQINKLMKVSNQG